MKTFFITAILICSSFIASAQDYSNENKEMYENILNEQLEKLNLSETQEEQFIQISNKYEDEIIAVRENNGSKWSKFKEMKNIRKSKNKEVKDLLDDDQYKIYIDLQEENQKELKELYKTRNG